MAKTVEELSALYPALAARHLNKWREWSDTVRLKSNGQEYGILLARGLSILDKLPEPLPLSQERGIILGLCGRGDAGHAVGVSYLIKEAGYSKAEARKVAKEAAQRSAREYLSRLEKLTAKPAAAPASRRRRTRKTSG